LPLFFKDKGKACVTSYGNGIFEGMIWDEAALEELFTLQDKGSLAVPPPGSLTINHHRPVERMYHAPEPKWLYKYEDAHVTCSKCGGKVSPEIIKNNRYEEDCDCPLCGGCDTFSFEYEEIGDVVKQ